MITMSPQWEENFKFRTGLEIAGLALALAGTGAGIAAAGEETSAMNRTENNALLQQNQVQQQAKNVFARSLEQSTPPVAKGQMDAGTQQALAQQSKLAAIPLTTDSSALSVTDPGEQQQVHNYVQQRGLANAQLQGMTQYELDQWIKNLNAQSSLGILGATSQNLNQPLPYELAADRNSQSTLASIGSLGTSLGGLGATAAASYREQPLYSGPQKGPYTDYLDLPNENANPYGGQ